MTKCKECVYSVKTKRVSQADFKTEIPVVECHRNAPVASVGSTSRDVSWPIVRADDCCGEGEIVKMLRVGETYINQPGFD